MNAAQQPRFAPATQHRRDPGFSKARSTSRSGPAPLQTSGDEDGLAEEKKAARAPADLLTRALFADSRARSSGAERGQSHKVNAARSYLQGDFSANAEHPMLMKWLVTLSVAGADCWNRGIGHARPILDETAVRFPNLVFGSLTAIVLFRFTQEMFGFEVGLTAAVLWAIGTPSIMVNRIAKEDTLLVFFTWLAYLFYLAVSLKAVEDLGWWEASDGTRLPDRRVVVEARRFGVDVFALITPTD